MLNLLGDLWIDPGSQALREPDWTAVLAHGSAKLHLYGKNEPRRGRKMGHVTCLGETADAAWRTACAVKAALGMPDVAVG